MEEQERLFDGAPEAVILGAQWWPGEGWRLRVRLRRQFEDWMDARTTDYEHLTTPELLDVLDVELAVIRVEMGC